MKLCYCKMFGQKYTQLGRHDSYFLCLLKVHNTNGRSKPNDFFFARNIIRTYNYFYAIKNAYMYIVGLKGCM